MKSKDEAIIRKCSGITQDKSWFDLFMLLVMTGLIIFTKRNYTQTAIISALILSFRQ